MTKIKFQCEACCYITHNKYDWNKHLLTNIKKTWSYPRKV